MPTYPESGVKLVVDTVDAQSAVDDLMSSLDELQGATYTVDVTADTSDAESAIADLPLGDETVDYTVDVNETGDDLTDLPLSDENVNFTVNEKKKVNDKEESDTNKGILATVKYIAGLQTIQTIWNITGTAVDLLEKGATYAIDPILQLGDAVAEVGAKTGGAIPNADKLINKIFYDDLGKSKEEVGKMIITAHGLGLPIEEATRAALTFTHTWSDVDSTQAITTFGTMLKTNLVDNMQQASDLMSVFFQQGGNKGGDALQVVNANSQSWKDMGLTAQQALSTISTLLKGNVDNATDAAKMIQTMDDNLTIAATNAKSPQADMLKNMGLANPKDKGQAMGADFINGFAAAFTNLPTDQQDLASGLFMGKGGKKFTGAIEAMNANSDMFKNVTDAAAIAADEVDNSLKGAIDDFVKVANGKMEEFLSSKAIDIPGKIDKLKQGLQDGMKVLAEGGTLSEGLTVALKPIGFDDEFHSLESALGNFVIAILQAVAIAQDIANQGAAAVGTRATVAKMGQTQLAFDLKIANPDEVAGDISTAVSRGVTPDQISKSVGTAVNELIKNGQPAVAQSLLDAVKNAQSDANANLQLTPSGSPMQVDPVVSPENITKLQKQIADAQANASLEASGAIITAKNDTLQTLQPIKSAVDVLGTIAKDVAGVLHGHANATIAVNTQSKTASTNLKLQSDATYSVVSSADAAVNPLLNVSSALDQIKASADGLKTSAAHVADVQGTLSAGNKPAPTKYAPGGEFTGTAIVGDAGPELVSSNMGLSVWNNATTNSFLQALQSFVPGSSGGSSQVSNTIVNYNNVPNVAVADALGFKQAATLRGAVNN